MKDQQLATSDGAQNQVLSLHHALYLSAVLWGIAENLLVGRRLMTM